MFSTLGLDFRVDHPTVMEFAFIPGVFECAMKFPSMRNVTFNPDPVPMEPFRRNVIEWVRCNPTLSETLVMAVMHHPAVAAIVRELRNARSPTPVLTEFERNITPPLSDIVRNRTPLLSDIVRNRTPLLQFSPGMYTNMHNEFQKIETKRQVSANFAKDLLEEFNPIKLEPYDDLHERNCFNRDWRNRQKRKMSLEEITEHKECICIHREKNELLERRSRFVLTRMLSQTAYSRQHMPFRYPPYSDITVSDAELPQCVSVDQYKQDTLDQAEFLNYKHIAH